MVDASIAIAPSRTRRIGTELEAAASMTVTLGTVAEITRQWMFVRQLRRLLPDVEHVVYDAYSSSIDLARADRVDRASLDARDAAEISVPVDASALDAVAELLASTTASDLDPEGRFWHSGCIASRIDLSLDVDDILLEVLRSECAALWPAAAGLHDLVDRLFRMR